MNINPCKHVRGRLRLPGDKSISHRAALIAAEANGRSKLDNFSTAVDCSSTLACLEQLGVEIDRQGSTVLIQGRQFAKPAAPLDCGNSGSTMRIMAGVLARQGFSSELTGDSSLTARPMKRVIDPLEAMGAMIESNNGFPPLKILGTKEIKPISYTLPVASAQVKSAILFAALGADGRTEVRESSLSRDHTERMFNGFGVKVTTSPNLTVTLDGPAGFIAGDMTVPGDVSSAAYFVAAAMLLPGSDLVLDGVGLNPTRAEYLSVMSAWGGGIATEPIGSVRNEPVGTIRVRGGLETNTTSSSARLLESSRIPTVIDELPLLAVVGTQVAGGIVIRDAGELRHKESDRLKSTVTNLRKMGAKVEEFADGLAVSGPTELKGAALDSYGDHRIAMAFTVAALIADGPTEIAGTDCVDISFPEFFELLNSITIR